MMMLLMLLLLVLKNVHCCCNRVVVIISIVHISVRITAILAILRMPLSCCGVVASTPIVLVILSFTV